MNVTINAPLSVQGNLAQPIAIPPDFKLVQDITYPDGKTYSGAAERCMATFSFLPANWPGATWFIDKFIAKHMADNLIEAGAKPLTLKLYESGFEYIMVIEAAKPAAASTAKAAIQIAWSVIVLAAIILAALIVIFFTIKSVEEFFYKSPAAATTAGLIALGIGGLVVAGIFFAKGNQLPGQTKKT